MTSPVNSCAESFPAATHSSVVSRWMLVSKRPDFCYGSENNSTNPPMPSYNHGERADNLMRSLCGGSWLQQQQRLPLTILFGSAVTSTSPRQHPTDTVAAPPWRPFSIHDDRTTSTTPSLTTTAAGYYINHDLRASAVTSTVDEVDRPVPHHHTVPQLRQYTATGLTPAVMPFVPAVLSDVASHQFHHQWLLSSVRQQVAHGGYVYPTHAVTGYAAQQCSQCSIVFSTFTELVRHQQSSCPSKSSSTSSSPQSGSTGSPPTRSPSPLLSCPHCDKVYTSSGALKMHVRTHTLPCRCPTCGKAFSRPWLLQGHLRTHTGERPFTCADCGRAFADRSNLRAHSQTHSAAKRYQCSTCRRSFSRLSLLVRHERHNTSGCCGGPHGNDDTRRLMFDERQK